MPLDLRTYPSRPVVGVGAIVESDGQIVLVRRRFEPLAGRWSLPGGVLELGETLRAGVARETLEETGLVVEVGPIVDVFDRIVLDEEQRVRYHFVLVDYLCRPLDGTLRHDSDADAAVYVDPRHLDAYGLSAQAVAVIEKALEMVKKETWPPRLPPHS